eukprot:scaffold86134_cov20-Tisochrysis_lutea.AAC.5
MHSRDAHMRARTLPIYMVCVSKVTGLFACTCVGLLAWSTVLLSKQAQGAQACLVFASCTVAPASVFLMPAFARLRICQVVDCYRDWGSIVLLLFLRFLMPLTVAFHHCYPSSYTLRH